jgi:tetratricopeptide (TPR) repeat protein
MSTKTAQEWNDAGDKLYDDEKYEEAIACYDRSIEINPKNEYAWGCKGIALNSLKRYEEAIGCWDKALKINPENEYAWCGKGDALYFLKRYEETIECYDKALKINPKYGIAWNNKGYTLFLLKQYQEAIKCLDQALLLNSDDEYVWENKGLVYVKLQHIDQALECFQKAKKEIWDIYALPDEELTEDEKDSIAEHLVLYYPFFKQVMEQYSPPENEKQTYQNIYRLSCKILCLLHAREDAKWGVAHYTQKKTFETLLLKEGSEDPKFHLHAITLSNDPSEGRTLLDFLYGKPMPKIESDVIALAGSFTFNPDCLNQFRLYGKNDTQEGAGVSIILRNSFFSKESIFQPASFNFSLKQEAISNSSFFKEYDIGKLTLFRCLYVDPETQQVISLGQREEYMFYREGLKGIENEAERKERIEEIRKKITDYNEGIKEQLENVRKSMDELRKLVQKKGLSPKIVSDLLTDLRTLTKHVAFREEQECRIVRAMNLSDCDDKKKIHYDPDSARLHTEYLPLAPFVQEVRFGPQFENSDYYAARLRINQNIRSTQSTHPLVCR